MSTNIKMRLNEVDKEKRMNIWALDVLNVLHFVLDLRRDRERKKVIDVKLTVRRKK